MTEHETIVLGGGCFWCVEAVFSRVPGIVETTCGYAGGSIANPTYEDVCGGETGHAEVVRVTFDRSVLSLADLLARFFASHDPTTVDRQGNDIGSQYRSIILVSDDQRSEAEAAREVAGDRLRRSIATEIVELSIFFPAEEYHQRYFEKNPEAGYCRAVIAPKMKNLGLDITPLA